MTAGGVGRTAGGAPPGGVGAVGEVQVSPGLHGALRRYQVMAFVVGVGLLVLVLVGVPLQYAANQPKVAQIVGPIHGFLYIVYLLAATDLARRARFSLLQMAAMIGAGFLPFLAFVIERRVSRRVRTEVLPSWSSLWRPGPAEPGSGLDD